MLTLKEFFENTQGKNTDRITGFFSFLLDQTCRGRETVINYLTKGYGTIIALSVALIVMVGQKLLIRQAKNDFKDMYYAKEMYLKTKNTEYLDFILARSKQMTNDVKVLSDRAKKEIAELRQFAEKYKK